jgi:hypothetical protein
LNIENADPCSDAHSNLAGIGTSDSGTKDDYLSRRDTPMPRREGRLFPHGLFPSTFLQQGWKLAQRFTHWTEERKGTIWLLNGFITNPDNPAL